MHVCNGKMGWGRICTPKKLPKSDNFECCILGLVVYCIFILVREMATNVKLVHGLLECRVRSRLHYVTLQLVLLYLVFIPGSHIV